MIGLPGKVPDYNERRHRIRTHVHGPEGRLASKSNVDPEIPDKLYFRIGEVAKLAGIKPYVLRFWESEFSGLGPKKSGSGQRLYRRKDVELVLEIKRLLYKERFTIEGARKTLESRRRAGQAASDPAAVYGEIRRGLAEILSILEHSGDGG
jgi:DNA-binding transcriptional MerR regulator